MPMLLRRCCLAFALTALGAAARAATLPAGFTETILTSSMTNPTAMALLPDGRILVTQQAGQLRVIENGALVAAPALSLAVDSNGERGLLGVAVDPSFASNHFIYLYYTATAPATHNRVSRFTLTGNTAGSATVLLDLDNLSTATNHNGGSLHFGNDGKLYIGVGENANSANSQTLANLLGKLLRINADGSIPTDNPFFSTPAGARKEIWAYGLRNPYTFAFRRTTGALFIDDVGQNTWEEINVGQAGANYDWPNTEGPISPPPTFPVVSPLYAYQHSSGTPTGCAITGGTFYDPPTVRFPASYVGKYFFADLCSGWIYLLDPAAPTTPTSFATGISQPVDLQVDSQGGLLYLSHAGTLARIAYAPPLQFYTLAPCRAIDTRGPNAPGIAASATRVFTIAGSCGIPTSAAAVSVNVTVVDPPQPGFLVLFAGNLSPQPSTSTLSFNPARTHANNATIDLSSLGLGTIQVNNASNATVDVVIDVNGYFQ